MDSFAFWEMEDIIRRKKEINKKIVTYRKNIISLKNRINEIYDPTIEEIFPAKMVWTLKINNINYLSELFKVLRKNPQMENLSQIGPARKKIILDIVKNLGKLELRARIIELDKKETRLFEDERIIKKLDQRLEKIYNPKIEEEFENELELLEQLTQNGINTMCDLLELTVEDPNLTKISINEKAKSLILEKIKDLEEF